MTYKLTSGWPQHVESGAFVNPETNPDYLEWLAAGNTPEPADFPPPETPEQKNIRILAEIHALELSEVMPRSLRTILKERCEADAAAIGMTLDDVYAVAVALGPDAPEAAKGWKKFKDFDDSIQALKAQLT